MDQDDFKNRCVGTLLGAAIGDALGAAVEGWDVSQIKEKYGHDLNGLRDYVPCKHMGLEDQEKRTGMYTDDTNCTLALASSIVKRKGLDAVDAAHSYVEYWEHTPNRGYPYSAERVLNAVKEGKDVKKTGTIQFKDGSFANGGAMRISPIGLVFRNASPPIRLSATEQAIISSHVHPEAVDGAYIQATAISHLLHQNPKTFDPKEYLTVLLESTQTSAMKRRISVLKTHVGGGMWPAVIFGLGTDRDDMKSDLESYADLGFQIEATVAVTCAVWSFVSSWQNPEECLMEAIALGGDTDTICSMVGAQIGALYGKEWIPERWLSGLEDGQWGKDHIISLAEKLSEFDFGEEDIVKAQ